MPHVLILAHGDGWLEAFAEREVKVRIEMVPLGDEQLTEQYLDCRLPRAYRKLHLPGLRRAAVQAERLKPSDIVWRQSQVDVLRAIRGLEPPAPRLLQDPPF